MSANIHITADGTAAMFNRGVPWHGLGQIVTSAQTWQDAAKLAKLDWTVSKHQLTNPLTGSLMNAYATFRDDTQALLGVVSKTYAPIQNAQAFDFVDTLLEANGKAHYESAGALGDGNQIWVLASVPYGFEVAGDRHETYILFETSHDRSKAATCKLTTVRVVCQNTLSMALGETNQAQVKVRHSKNGTAKLEAAKRLLSGAKQTVETVAQKLNFLAAKKMTPDASMQVMDTLFGKDWRDSSVKRNQISEIATLFAQADHGKAKVAGTAYNLYNAVTEWSDHFRDVRITSDRAEQGITEAFARQEGALFRYDDWKTQALNSILEAVEYAPALGSRDVSKVDDVLAKMSV